MFVFDNGSENVADIRSLADSEYTTLRVEADPNNRGIAFALNRLLDAAKEHGFKHMLLLDQDSVPCLLYTSTMIEGCVTLMGTGQRLRQRRINL